MKKINLGRVLPVFRGAYDGNEIYTKLDIVEFNGSSYVAKQTTTGVEPTDPDEGAENWIMVAQAGQATWEALTPQQKAAIYQDIINIVFGEYNDRLTLSHGGNTVSFFDDGNITTKKHNLDTIAQSIQTNANAITTKANANNVYTKQQINSTVSTLQDADTEIYNYAKDGFTNIDLDIKNMKDALDGKADAADVYTTTQVDNKVSVVANAVSSLAGNTYTKSQINSTVNGINQNIETLQNTTYSRTFLDNALSGKADTESTFPKVVSIIDTEATITINSTQTQNITYFFTQPLTSLTLAAVPNIGCETTLIFESGSTPTSFTYPNTLEWIGNSELYTVAPNTKYAISILYGVACMAPINDNTGSN